MPGRWNPRPRHRRASVAGREGHAPARGLQRHQLYCWRLYAGRAVQVTDGRRRLGRACGTACLGTRIYVYDIDGHRWQVGRATRRPADCSGTNSTVGVYDLALLFKLQTCLGWLTPMCSSSCNSISDKFGPATGWRCSQLHLFGEFGVGTAMTPWPHRVEKPACSHGRRFQVWGAQR